ncbi:MAG: carbon storage regulator [Thermoguttaceae bacterium]
MLVLSRGRKTEICIGSDITIRVIAIHKSQVTLGIEAPSTVRILRKEVVPVCLESERSVVHPLFGSQQSCLAK